MPALTPLLPQCTVPLVEVNSYERQWFLVSLAASPLFIAAFLELLGNWKVGRGPEVLGV